MPWLIPIDQVSQYGEIDDDASDGRQRHVQPDPRSTCVLDVTEQPGKHDGCDQAQSNLLTARPSLVERNRDSAWNERELLSTLRWLIRKTWNPGMAAPRPEGTGGGKA